MNERTSRFLNFMAWSLAEGEDGVELLLKEDYYNGRDYKGRNFEEKI